ncbi:hypothetical protein CDAR_227141 [Caerostris darwini]|uniref:Uncharacterized protein n=1 Tax=Caerostris darwini TaxID=1538125 RepID=A0AAV4PAF4_9ARAC|nr:hypothetical protein CDAR_227141 [Caerostris darwini]
MNYVTGNVSKYHFDSGGNESKPAVMKGRSSQSSGCNASAMKSRPNEFVYRIYSGALSEDSATGSTPAARIEDGVLVA